MCFHEIFQIFQSMSCRIICNRLCSKLKIGNEFANTVFDSQFLLVHDIPARATKSSELFSQTKK